MLYEPFRMTLAEAREFEERRKEELRVTAFWMSIALVAGLVLIVFRFLLTYLSAGFANGRWNMTGVAATALLWSLAWFAAGFLFGFLFGIPKALQGQQVPPTAGSESVTNGKPYRLRVNTNLEEISDWLTKILVGATLTQLSKVPSLVRDAADYVGTTLGHSNPTTAGAIVLYFSTLGFFTGYVLTRMFFSGAFLRSDQGLNPDDVAAMQAINIAPEPSAAPMATTKELRLQAARVAEVPISEDMTGEELYAIATAALMLRNYDRALGAAKLASEKAPRDPKVQLAYSTALFRSHAHSETVFLQLRRTLDALSFSADPTTREDIYNSVVYISLYQDPPQGFEQALTWGQQAIDTVTPTRQSLWVNLACAGGQKYQYLKRTEGADSEKLREARASVVHFVEQCLKNFPNAKARLVELTNPRNNDSDLAAVAADSPELRALLS